MGIRVYLAVGKGGAPAPNFAISSLTAKRQHNGRPAVAALVRNTGGRALDLSGKLTLGKGPDGLSAGPFTAQLGTTIAPGQSEPVTVTLNTQVPDGPWKALIHLKSGLTSRTAEATITFPDGAGASKPRKTAAQKALAQTAPAAKGSSFFPEAVIAALVLLAALGFAVLRRSRRSHQMLNRPSWDGSAPLSAAIRPDCWTTTPGPAQQGGFGWLDGRGRSPSSSVLRAECRLPAESRGAHSPIETAVRRTRSASR